MAELTDEQRAVYDRQLRVWGLETQSKCALPPTPPGVRGSLTPGAHAHTPG